MYPCLIVNICLLQFKYLSTAGKLNGMDHPPVCLQSAKSYRICDTNFKLSPTNVFIFQKCWWLSDQFREIIFFICLSSGLLDSNSNLFYHLMLQLPAALCGGNEPKELFASASAFHRLLQHFSYFRTLSVGQIRNIFIS